MINTTIRFCEQIKRIYVYDLKHSKLEILNEVLYFNQLTIN